MSCDPSANGFQTINDYVLGPSGEQVTEMAMDANGSMAWQHTNVWAGGKLLATYDPDGLHFYLNDPLGTRRAQTDYAGVLEQTCQSLPFGNALNCTGSTQYPTEHHFTGKERDTESGNDYFEARYYSSAMGRFMSPDWSAKVEPVPYAKLDDPQSLNLYAYVRNNPLSRVDIDGHLEGSEENKKKRESISANADAQVGQTGYRYNDQPKGQDKCSNFVSDTIHDGGADAKFKTKEGTERAPLAGEWLNPKAKIENWRPLGKGEKPQPGDVAAEAIVNPRAGATGHVGIVVGVAKDGQVTVAAGENGPVYRTNKEFLPQKNIVTFRRYTGD